MTKAEEQILLNQIMIMEAMITIFHQSNDDSVACRNLEIYAGATYDFLKKNRGVISMVENEARGDKSMNNPYTKNSPNTETCEKCLYINSRCKCNKSETNENHIGINEAKEYLLNRYLVVGSPVNPSKEECKKHNDVLDMAIKALEEIQAYRAIGTVEECLNSVNEAIDKHNLMIVYRDRLKDYEAIGTVEEFKALKEKSVAKKPINISKHNCGLFDIGNCPYCGEIVMEDEMVCEMCFQVLDWQ